MILVRGVAVALLLTILVSAILSLIGRSEWFAVVWALAAIAAGSVVMGRAVMDRRSAGD